MDDFTYNMNPGRVVFGSGTIERLPEELERLGLRHVLVITAPHRVADAIGAIGDRAITIFTKAAMHTPANVTDQAMALVRAHDIDGVVAIGGGSAIGLGKAIALRTDLPQIVVPTTYAGSEMTPILGETKDGTKVTQSHPHVLPEVVIYDVDLTLTLPPSYSAASGLNAMAHAVEALYARDNNPVISLIAIEAITTLARALPAIMADPLDKQARAAALYGAWLCGTCLGTVGMAMHHKLCHTLGGAFNLPHAETHAVMLPHALAYTLPATPDVARRLSLALGTDDPARALYDLAGRLGAPRSLAQLGMAKAAIEAAADRALTNPYWNPRPLEHRGVRALIGRAWAGEPPLAET